MAFVSPAGSWLNSFDPTNSSTLSGLVATGITDPITRTTPPGFDVLKPAPNPAPAPPSSYQQALNAFTVTADTFLVQSAINGYQPIAAPIVLGSPAAAFASLGQTITTLKNAALSGNYGSLNALA